MENWLGILDQLTQAKEPCVLVTVAHTEGSAPREAGAKMLVAPEYIYGTIGGGNLEHQAIQVARTHFANKQTTSIAFTEIYVLGPMMRQCCGGVVFLQYEILLHDALLWLNILKRIIQSNSSAVIVTRTGNKEKAGTIGGKVIITETQTSNSLGDSKADSMVKYLGNILLQDEKSGMNTLFRSLNNSKGRLPDYSDALLFEVVRPCDFHIVLFGAGHIGSAIIRLLDNTIFCRVTWVDSRKEMIPKHVPYNVEVQHRIKPASIVPKIPTNSYCLIMTHSHDQDREICETILKREDINFVGLIGSETKRKRFIKRMKEKGMTKTQLARLTCPIGIQGITSKAPDTIAISVVAQLLQLRESKLQTQQRDKQKIQAL